LDFVYLIFGLRVRSTHGLPGLQVAVKPTDQVDVSVHFGISPPITGSQTVSAEEPVFATSIRLKTGEPWLRISKVAGGELLRMDYADGTQFWLDAQGREVWARWSETSSFEDAASYLLGPVFGYLLRLRGVTCLHASAVQCGGRAVTFVGAEGAGKSTTAAAMALRGHAVLSDDIVALAERDGEFYAMPAYPYLSLWRDSVDALYGADGNLSAFSANYSKRMLPLAERGLRFSGEPAVLDSIFLLGERSSDAGAPVVEEVEKRDALMALVGNTYANRLLDEEMRAREFALLGRLVAAVPVRRLRAHQDPSRISALCESIESEVPPRRSAASPASERR
jgi:hypothetical protein